MSIPMAPEINEIIAEVDKDGSGAIEFDEFFHMITSKFVEMGIKEKLTEVFHIIDQDKNGKIYFADIQRIGRELNVNFTENEIQDTVDEAYRDRDGEVNAQEFLRIMSSTSCGYWRCNLSA
ncbi:probable calcium-binding protein CML13 isoform X2 [Primulina huaijiensis]|uniref:probable calcium-binding protein CML13 isoform X2 n=1 Tax=Primulina huaijiensis TaxID=1492673 RepID=UPI003CC75A53